MSKKTIMTLFSAIAFVAVAVLLWSHFNSSADRVEKELDQPAAETDTQSLVIDQTETAQIVEAQPQNAPIVIEPDSAKPADLSPKVHIVRDILNSKNDNDPRLDTELKVLDESTKAELRDFYQTRKPEDRNGRGTVVFLLGRNISSPQDVDFMENVFAENPCLSLEDCSRDTAVLGSHEEGHDNSQDITLSYPKLVALNALEKLIRSQGGLSPEMKKAAWRALNTAEKSPESRVANKAADIKARIGL